MRFLFAALLTLACFSQTLAQSDPLKPQQTLELAVPFTDNMILQREMNVPIWGFDQPGSTVTVEFAGQTKTATTNAHGDWQLELEPLVASKEPRSFKVTSSSGGAIELENVLVGEVWFASGQSNMVWIAGKSMVRDLAQELSRMDDELPIREININTVSAIYPQKRATALDDGWRTVKQAHGFSALALSFAYSLYEELDVPIGILLSAHSNTRVEAFATRESFENHPKLQRDVKLIHDGDPRTTQGREAFKQYERDLRAWQEQAIAISEAGGLPPQKPKRPGIAGMWRGPSQFFSGKINPVVPYAVRGAIWCQGTSNSGDSLIYAHRMEALVDGWREAWDRPDMPFYFTQMQAYGSADSSPDNVGFADIRQAQFEFFLNNRDNVGMVVQTDLNSARPQGIHYFNKLHPGMRLARWALAHDYGKDIAYTGPIYQGYQVEGNKVIVSFEPDSLFGGLMVGSKGMAKDHRDPEKYTEPARPTPGDKLNHFRLCGPDHKWHAADAKIVGDTVVVTSDAVPNPVGVQYAYNAVPMNSNLYNKAGLPATPFAAIDGKLIFQKGLEPKPAAATQQNESDTPQAVRPFLHIANYYRHGAVVQRNQPIHVWGHANPGAEVKVTLGDQTVTTTANELDQWSVTIPAMKASTTPITLTVETSLGPKREVGDILVGDVWYLTGQELLTGEMAHHGKDKDAPKPQAMPLVREFRKKTKASNNPTPRKRGFEIGGGRFRSSWQPADYNVNEEGVSMFAYEFAKALNRPGVPQGFITMSSRKNDAASPLSWTSYQGVENLDQPEFQARLNELALQYPGSKVAKDAMDQYIADIQATVDTIVAIEDDGDLSKAPLGFPKFPVPGSNPDVPRTAIPTYTYNWCVSPLTPMAVSGVIWMPAEYSLGQNPEHYATELEIYAASLPETYGQDEVLFMYAHPTASLVEGIKQPNLPQAKTLSLETWPKSLKQLANDMAKLVPQDE